MENPDYCSKCDQKLFAKTKHLLFYKCGRVTNLGGLAAFTCLHEGRGDKTRCRADTGRPLVSFREWLENKGLHANGGEDGWQPT